MNDEEKKDRFDLWVAMSTLEALARKFESASLRVAADAAEREFRVRYGSNESGLPIWYVPSAYKKPESDS